MEIWEDVQVKIKTVAENAKVEAEKLSGIAKIKLNVADLKLKRRRLYESIGKEYYLRSKTIGNDIADADKNENINSLCSKLDEINAQIKELNRRLNDYNNKTVCSACGAKLDAEMSFCPRCGKIAE